MLFIGDRVRVYARADMGYRKKIRKVFRERYIVKGWIVGATRRQLGMYQKGSQGPLGFHGVDFEPAYLWVTGTVFVYRVTIGMLRKPFDVLPCDLTLLEHGQC